MPYSNKSANILIGVGLLCFAALGMAACGQPSSRPPTAAPGSRQNIVGPDVAKSYTSLAQLRQDATWVALVRATGKSVTTTVGGVPYTISTVAVLKTVSGPPLPATIGLRQLGKVGNSQGLPVVSAIGTYIGYIQQFKDLSGVVAGQYVVIGGTQGLFYDASGAPTNPKLAAFARVNQDAIGLPAAISLAQAAQS